MMMRPGLKLTFPTLSPYSTFCKQRLTWEKRFRECVGACAVEQSAWLLLGGRGCCWRRRPRFIFYFIIFGGKYIPALFVFVTTKQQGWFQPHHQFIFHQHFCLTAL